MSASVFPPTDRVPLWGKGTWQLAAPDTQRQWGGAGGDGALLAFPRSQERKATPVLAHFLGQGTEHLDFPARSPAHPRVKVGVRTPGQPHLRPTLWGRSTSGQAGGCCRQKKGGRAYGVAESADASTGSDQRSPSDEHPDALGTSSYHGRVASPSSLPGRRQSLWTPGARWLGRTQGVLRAAVWALRGDSAQPVPPTSPWAEGRTGPRTHSSVVPGFPEAPAPEAEWHLLCSPRTAA